MDLKVSLTGYKEIDNLFKNLPKPFTHQFFSSVHADAAKPLVQKEKLTAPEGPTGNLVDSIGVVKSSVKKATQLGLVTVGPRRKGKYKGYAAHLVEEGTEERKLKGRGKYKRGTKRGVMPAKPFVEPSYQATKRVVEAGITKSIGKMMVRTMKKYVKK